MTSPLKKKTYYIKKNPEENQARVRKGFDVSGGVKCKECFEKSREIDHLKEELKLLNRVLKNPSFSPKSIPT